MFEDLITDRTLEDVQNRTAKGHYNTSDLNRVEHAVKEISELLTKEAYPVVYQPHKRFISTEEWDENTVLLLHGDELVDSSKNAVPLTNNGVKVSAEQSKFGDKSLYFSGTSRLEFSSSYVNFGSGNFTIEWWERPTSTSNGARFCSQYGVIQTGLSVGNSNTQLLLNSNYTSPSWNLINASNAFSITINTWTHWAVVRNGSIVRTYRNGHKFFETNIGQANIIINNSVQSAIGVNPGNNSNFVGFINEFRISNIARYLGDFIPQTEPFESKSAVKWDENTVLLLNGNEILDSSKNSILLTNNGVTVSTAQSKFGGKSLYFNGSSRLEFPCSYVDFGSGDFTVEWWEYLTTQSVGAIFVTQAGVPKTGLMVSFQGTKLYLNSNYQNEAWNIINAEAAFASELNKWVHCAVVRNKNIIYTFKNGTLFYSKDIGDVYLNINTAINAAIGVNAGLNNFYKGYINDFRISNIARYTEDFTPPTEQFVAKIEGETGYVESDWVDPENYDGVPDHPTASEMERYLHNLSELKRQFYQQKDTPRLPTSMSRLTHTTANNIEQFVKDTGSTFESMQMIKRKSGTFKVGELLP